MVCACMVTVQFGLSPSKGNVQYVKRSVRAQSSTLSVQYGEFFVRGASVGGPAVTGCRGALRIYLVIAVRVSSLAGDCWHQTYICQDIHGNTRQRLNTVKNSL